MPGFCTIDVNDIKINEKEFANRLKVPVGFENDIISDCFLKLKEKAKPRFCFEETAVTLLHPSEVNLGFTKFFSKDLYKNLLGCKRCYVMAVTLGMEVDRFISVQKTRSLTRGFVADAIASAMAECVADYASDSLNQKLKPRFSPGYGDLPLEIQKDVLNFLNADKLLGIKLGANLLMSPRKTITAIQGVLEK